jgi:hypothetical protein
MERRFPVNAPPHRPETVEYAYLDTLRDNCAQQISHRLHPKRPHRLSADLVPAIVESRRELFGRHLITIEDGATDSIQPTGLDSHDETRLQTVKPPISIYRCRALSGPEANPWDVVHRRMSLIDRPHIRLMPNATGLRDLGMEDSDRWVLGVVAKFHRILLAPQLGLRLGLSVWP